MASRQILFRTDLIRQYGFCRMGWVERAPLGPLCFSWRFGISYAGWNEQRKQSDVLKSNGKVRYERYSSKRDSLCRKRKGRRSFRLADEAERRPSLSYSG